MDPLCCVQTLTKIYIWNINKRVNFVNILVYAFNRHLKGAHYIKHLYTQTYAYNEAYIIYAPIIYAL